MSKRLIGYGYTNANGVATLDYDAEGNELSSSGYVGQGVGEVDISASAVIDGSTFVSETYSVWDTINYDNAIDGDAREIWNAPTGSGILSRLEDSSKFYEESGSQSLLTTTISVKDNFCIEFDAKIPSTATNMDFILFIQSGSNISKSQFNNVSAPADTWCHFKLTIDSSLTDSYDLYCVETDKHHKQASGINTSGGTLYWGFRINNSSNYVQFRNVKIYNA